MCHYLSVAEIGRKWSKVDGGNRPGVPGDPPRGTVQARVDDKGRLKLPVAIQQYLGRLGENKVFITTLDLRSVRLYPTSLWQENEAFFSQPSDDPDALADIQLLANHYGADSEGDAQGRVLFPTDLRRELGMENQPVWLECQKGRINVYTQQEYGQRLDRAKTRPDEKLRSLESKGLK